jgi:hypothetical protein
MARRISKLVAYVNICQLFSVEIGITQAQGTMLSNEERKQAEALLSEPNNIPD